MTPYVNVLVKDRNGSSVAKVRLPESATVEDLKQAIFDDRNRSGAFAPVRQRLTLPAKPGTRSGQPLPPNKTLCELGFAEDVVVIHKDLGTQVSYALVFVLEYLGPLLIYPTFWASPIRGYVYSDDTETRQVAQDLACVYWCAHYAKRILETAVIHKFSHGTMPIFNLFRNCAYYWLFAAFVSYFINHPRYTPPPVAVTVGCLAAAYLCQVGNFLSHVILSSLRKRPSDGYSIPRGFLFNYVTCANYTFEIWGWILFSVATQSLPAAIFCACGSAQMAQWAVAKHKRLKRLFDGKEGREKYPRRWIIFPPLL